MTDKKYAYIDLGIGSEHTINVYIGRENRKTLYFSITKASLLRLQKLQIKIMETYHDNGNSVHR